MRPRCATSRSALLGAVLACTALGTCKSESAGLGEGGEGDPCYPDGTCDLGLSCQSDTCVVLNQCQQGETASCNCGICYQGARSCQSDGTWGSCDCSCTPGERVPCTDDFYDDCFCSAPCLWDGTLGMCECPCAPGRSDRCQCGIDDWSGIQVCNANRDWQECRCEDTCGNGVLDPGEPCDASELGSSSCSEFGYPGGVLKCSPLCTYDFTSCEPRPDCGDGWAAGFWYYNTTWEPCEPGLELSYTCAYMGFLDGELTCAANCTLDTTGCRTERLCGDGTWDWETGESCDGSDLGITSCTHLGFAGGVLACDPLSCQFDTSGCLTE